MFQTNVFARYLALVAVFPVPFTLTAQDPSFEKVMFRDAAVIVREIKAYDKARIGKDSGTYRSPFQWNYLKKTLVTVTYTNKMLRRLNYINLLEPDRRYATETYYFDSTAHLVCRIDRTTATPYYEVYIPPYLVQYVKAGDPANHIVKDIDAQEALSRAKFNVDYYLSNGAIFDYTSFDLFFDTIGILQVKKRLQLREKASAKAPLLQTLRKGTTLIYLDRSSFTDSVRGIGRWVWYKVKTKSGKTGWVWGYPTGLEQIIDD